MQVMPIKEKDPRNSMPWKNCTPALILLFGSWQLVLCSTSLLAAQAVS